MYGSEPELDYNLLMIKQRLKQRLTFTNLLLNSIIIDLKKQLHEALLCYNITMDMGFIA